VNIALRAVFGLVLLLGGCAEDKPAAPSPEAAAPAEKPAEPAAAAKLADIEAELAALRKDGDPAKPSVARLKQIEGEIHALIAQQAPPPPIPLAAPAQPAKEASAAAGSFGIHLASYQLKGSVADGWAEYRKAYGAVLDGLEPRVASVDLHDGRGTLYRLKAGPFASAAAAAAACKKVESFPGGYCKVMDFTGEPGAEFWRHAGS